MWQTENTTPFAATGYFLRDARGLEHWVVAIRATFDIDPAGFPRISADQTAPRLVPHYDGAAAEELLEDSDFCPFRPAADVVLHGTAMRDDAKAASVIPVTLAVGAMTKTLRCYGARRVEGARSGPIAYAAEPVASVPLGWRSALGGASQIGDATADLHPDNPIGQGWIDDWSRLRPGMQINLPAVEDLAYPIVPGQAFPPPAGFGAIQPHWRPRQRLAGTYDDGWLEDRHPLLPADFDPAFHHAAPADQRLALKGGEPVSIENVGSNGPISLRLPQIVFTARTGIGRARTDDRPRLIGLCIDADALRFSMIWNVAVPCNGRDTEVEGSTVRMVQASGFVQ